MKTFRVVNDDSLILRKINPHRKRSGIIEYTQQDLVYESGLMGKAEVVGSLNPIYPIGSYVFVLQMGQWKLHGAGYGCLEPTMRPGDEFQIEGNPKTYINEGDHLDRQHLFIKVRCKDPFGVATLKDDVWHLTPVNKNFLVRIVNPQAGTETLAKAGVKPSSKIIIPNYKDVKQALQQKGSVVDGTIMSGDSTELNLHPHSKVVLLVQGAENNAADPGFDEKEWQIDTGTFIPKGYFTTHDPDVRSLPYLHLFVEAEDFMAEVL